jgi:nitrogen fixation protein FixH
MMPSSWDPMADAIRARRYPLIFIGAFLAVIAVNAVMMTLAISTFSGVETPRHYAQGLAYNQVLAATRAQAALGWKVDVRAVPLAAAEGMDGRSIELQVVARDVDGRPIDDLALRALAIRPTRAGLDRELALEWGGQGVYRGTLDLPLPGVWDLRLVGHRGETPWQGVHRLQLP